MAAHLAGRDDGLARVAPVLSCVDRFAELIEDGPGHDAAFHALRAAERTGRPVGTRDSVLDLERGLGRPLAPRGRGRKPTDALVAQAALFGDGRDNLSPISPACAAPPISVVPKARAAAADSRAFTAKILSQAAAAERRRRAAPAAPKPTIISAQVPGSGTAKVWYLRV